MSQFRGARVRVQNGSATVRFVYSPTTGGITGTYIAAEAVTWGVDGVGVYVSDDGVTVRFYRTSGAIPAVGNTITGAGGATSVISSFPAENLSLTTPASAQPPRFSDSPTQGAISTNDDFVLVGLSEPVAKVSATIANDSFDLTANWAGTTLTDVECAVNRDFTANFGWVKISASARAFFQLIQKFQEQVDADMAALGGGAAATAFSNFTLTSPWRNIPSRAVAAHSYAAASDTTHLKGFIDSNNTSVATGATIVSSGNGLPIGPPNRRPSERLDIFAGEWIAIHPDGSITFEGSTGIPGPIDLTRSFRADV